MGNLARIYSCVFGSASGDWPEGLQTSESPVPEVFDKEGDAVHPNGVTVAGMLQSFQHSPLRSGGSDGNALCSGPHGATWVKVETTATLKKTRLP